ARRAEPGGKHAVAGRLQGGEDAVEIVQLEPRPQAQLAEAEQAVNQDDRCAEPWHAHAGTLGRACSGRMNYRRRPGVGRVRAGGRGLPGGGPGPTIFSNRGNRPRATCTGEVMAIQKVEPGRTRIGWIGTGVMGRWMCEHAMKAGYRATVYNRSKDKAKPLLDAGAAFAESPRAVAEK